MPVIRDIQLSFLKVKEHTRNIEALQLTSTSNYDEDISFGKDEQYYFFILSTYAKVKNGL